jgi:hypothetical protein
MRLSHTQHKEYSGRAFLHKINMKIDQQLIDSIKEQFDKMQTKADFIKLLNDTKKILYGEDAGPVTPKALYFFADYRNGQKRYKQFAIKKKSGGSRTINAPKKGLKTIQKVLNIIIQCVFEPHSAATGFVPDKSVVDNAKAHTGKNYVYNIDLKDFFPSIEIHRVKACFKIPPFNLKDDREPLAFLIANLCCTEMEVERLVNGEWLTVKRSVLPQGAPTSPTITNIVSQSLDKRLANLAASFGATYTRYADDITFSSDHSIYQKNGKFLNKLNEIIRQNNFTINQKKVRLQKTGHRQEVTGITVNEKTNVSQRYIKQIRMWLYYWETYGYDKAEQIFRKDYIADRGYVKSHKAKLINVIDGKLLYLKMVRGENDLTCLKLKDRFIELISENSPVNILLDIWENEGIDQAIEVFNQKYEKYEG